MSGDIVERLRRAHQTVPIPSIASLYSNAADEIERLRAENERLRALITEWDVACVLFAGARPMADPEGFRLMSNREHLAHEALTQEARRG